MIIRTTVRPMVFPEMFHQQCSKAEHAVAVQAERDSRRYIPSKRIMESGKVVGQYIFWDGPNARLFYFGNVYENPNTHVAGYQLSNGAWRSNKGQKVMRKREYPAKNGSPGRYKKFKFVTGTDQWFYHAKTQNIGKWMKLAQEVITVG